MQFNAEWATVISMYDSRWTEERKQIAYSCFLGKPESSKQTERANEFGEKGTAGFYFILKSEITIKRIKMVSNTLVV